MDPSRARDEVPVAALASAAARIFHRRQLVRRLVERGIGIGQRRDNLLDGMEIAVGRIHAELARGLTQIGDGRFLEHDASAMSDFGAFSDRSTGSPGGYRTYIEQDPHRRGLHYPAVISEIGDLDSKHILDVGTGDGQLPRLLAQEGATVVGYDHNPGMIKEALGHQDNQKLDVEFAEAKAQNFSHKKRFDAATSVMVLNYARDVDDLTAFFRSTQQHLIAGGRFVSIVLNPTFVAFGTDLIVRRFTRLAGNGVRVEFLDEMSGELKQQAHTHQYQTDEFVRAAVDGGMRPEAWKKLFASPEAMQVKGERFWRACHEHQPYAMFIVRKI